MSSQMIHDIQSAIRTLKRPDGDDYLSLAVKDTAKIAADAGVPGREVEIAALENGIIPERYTRNMKMLTSGDQLKLLGATVSIVGLGGLGGTVTEMLARLGVGWLKLIDGDIFEDSNLNRQVTSRIANIGMPKADAARKRVLEINSGITVESQRLFLEEANAPALIQGSDVVVDCLDSLYTRLVLEKFAKKMKIPMVSAAVAGGSGHVTVIFPEDPGLQLIYGDNVDPSMKGAEASLGCLPHAVTLLSSIECSEVIKIILNKGTLSRNQLLVVDLSDNSFETLNLV